MGAAISIRDLVVRYGDTTALDGIDLEVEAGTVLGVLGPNGAGKTTLIRVLATQQTPTSGTATIAGHDVVADRRAVQRRIGVTGQYAALDDDLTVTENLHLVASLAGIPARAATPRIDQLAARLHLPRDRARLGELSGGTRRRVDLAAGLLTHPDVVILDEPTTGLDPRSRQQLWDVIDGLAHDGVTVVLTTQYLEEADHLADRIVFLHHGRIVDDGTPAAIKGRIGGQVVSFRFRTSEGHARAEQVLRSRSVPVGLDGHGLVLAGRVPDAARALELVAAVEDLGVEVDELQVTTASLDDAFHQLTAA
jgi:ABC-type multidrug transport system ATPase subunit